MDFKQREFPGARLAVTERIAELEVILAGTNSAVEAASLEPLRVQSYYAPYLTCRTCGERMIGDGYNTVLHCPNVPWDDHISVEPDAQPIHCSGDED